jgi:hypothetical protein
MNYERFSQLWDALIANRPKLADAAPITNGMTQESATALIEYGQGKKERIQKVRTFLATPAKA